MKPTITAIVITKNEEPRIGECIRHLSWADEILVVDNGSTDKTVDIARKLGATIYTVHKHDFSEVRETGLKAATGDWVLYIDADETVPSLLRDEIQKTMTQSNIGVFAVTRDTYYLGYHWPYKDRVERLFLRSRLEGWQGTLHETPLYTGSIGTLRHPLEHRTHRTIEEMVAKTNEWSRLEAELRMDIHHPPVVWWRFIRVMFTGFWRSFVTQEGWKAGTVGWIESIYQAFSMFITYAKLWELQIKHRS